MLIVIITFIVSWFIFSAIYYLKEETINSNFLAITDLLLSAPILILIKLLLIVTFPFIFLYIEFKLIFKGVKRSVWESYKYKGIHCKQLGNFVFVYSPKNVIWYRLYIARFLKETNIKQSYTEAPKEKLNLKLPN